MGDIDYSYIDPNSVRGIAYEKAKEMPGHKVRFQAQDGFSTVVYRKGTEAVEVMGIIAAEAKPGFWYEVAERDITKQYEDSSIGVRVTDKMEKDDA